MSFKILLKASLGFLLSLVISIKVSAQNDYPREVVNLDMEIWLGLAAQVQIDSSNVFLVEMAGKHTTSDYEDDFLYEKSVRLLYERRLSDRWNMGLGYQYSDANVGQNIFRGYFRHYSPISKIDLWLWQQVAFERVGFDNGFFDPVSRLQFELGATRAFQLNGHKNLIGNFSLELSKEIQREDSGIEKRFFQQSYLQTAWYFPFSERVYLGAFTAIQTDYFIALAQFDMDNEMIRPNRRLNIRRPVFGVQAILSLGKITPLIRRTWTN